MQQSYLHYQGYNQFEYILNNQNKFNIFKQNFIFVLTGIGLVGLVYNLNRFSVMFQIFAFEIWIFCQLNDIFIFLNDHITRRNTFLRSLNEWYIFW